MKEIKKELGVNHRNLMRLLPGTQVCKIGSEDIPLLNKVCYDFNLTVPG